MIVTHTFVKADHYLILSSVSRSDRRRAAAGAERAEELHRRHHQGALQMENQEDKEREVTLEDLPAHDL